MSHPGDVTRDDHDRPTSAPAIRGGDPGDLAAEMRNDVDHLVRLVCEQEETLAALERELRRCHATLGWRLHVRCAAPQRRIARVPLLRGVHGVLRRAVEVWVDEGFAAIFRKSRHKIHLALRGRPFLVAPYGPVPAEPGSQHRQEIERAGAATGDSPEGGTITPRLRATPLVSVLTVLPVDDPAALQRLLATLLAQSYEHWELCVAVPSTPSTDAPLERGGPDSVPDRRLRLVDCAGHRPSYADAFHASQGGIIALLGGHDELAREALFEAVARLDGDDDAADLVYTDEDAITARGEHRHAFFKPGWSPDLLLSMCYLERFVALRRQTVEEAGGFCRTLGPGQAYDLMLRVTEKTPRIAHIPHVLYHRRLPAPTLESVLGRHEAEREERAAIERALRRQGYEAATRALFTLDGPRGYSTRLGLRNTPLVSIVIPTRDHPQLLQTAIETIRARTAYREYEVIVVDNGSTDPGAVRYLKALEPPCHVYRWPHEFNYSAINNFGVEQARGAQLLFLNNDVEIVHADWLTALVEHAQRPEVGAVGAKLLYPDGRIQHAGVVLGVHGPVVHAFRGWPGRVSDDPRLADVVRNCSAVTGACMMVPRRVFELAGGFDPELRIAFNDIDLCLRIRQHGYRVVYTPHSVLTHFESATRGDGEYYPPADRVHFETRWGALSARGDPYHNPNLAGRQEDWSLPRVAGAEPIESR